MKRRDILDYEDYIEIANFCNSIGIEFMTTLFDIDAINIIGPYLNIFKVASPDLVNKQLLSKISVFNKPIIISTGASLEEEVEETIHKHQQNEIVLMHCIASYPIEKKDLNLSYIKHLNKKFNNLIIGYSDHFDTKHSYEGFIPYADFTSIETAYALGANVIEKHFTVTPTVKSSDHFHSINKEDTKKLIMILKEIKNSMFGSFREGRTVLHSERGVRLNGRRSFYATENIKIGEIIEEKNTIALRPHIVDCNIGVLGIKAEKEYKKGEPIVID